MNYFDFFSLPTQYALNLDQLEKQYLNIQQTSHPDKLAKKTADERYNALSHSIEANNAYTTLKDPLLRAKHLLSLQNINIDQEIRANTPTSLLQQSFMDRENLEETDDIDDLRTMLAQAKNDIKKIEQALTKEFQANNIQNIIFETISFQYKNKLLSEIKNKIKKVR